MTLLPFQQCLPKNYGSNGRPLEGTSSSDGADEAEGLQLRDDFMWGFATASAQIEGGGEDKEKASGRGRSIWDMLCDRPGAIEDGAKVYDTCNHLDMYKEDIAMMKSLGANTYRFSVAWPRVIPDGGRDDPVNEKGIKFYNDLIDECLKQGITPFLYVLAGMGLISSWDLPETLYHRYGGFLNKEEIVKDYVNYAKLCFDRFGDRVKWWLTFNEPWCVAALGYGYGRFAPAHASNTEPWIVGHNVMVAHAHASHLYRTQYKSRQGGSIGITLNGDWVTPYDDSPENIQAAQDKMDVAVGWFADPIYLGQYPVFMKKMLGDRLPEFTAEELDLLKGSSEFYGMNTYTTHAIRAGSTDELSGNAFADHQLADGSFLGPESSLDWLRDVPWGLRALLNYIYNRYNLPIYMTENGYAPKGESGLPVEKAIHDDARVEFYRGYLNNLAQAVNEDGVDVRSYLAWSFMDNFEWDSGLGPRFGVVHTNYETKERRIKDSAYFVQKWFGEHIGSKSEKTNGH